ncbi:MAG: LysM peptidoglycan-binding domain-containing protein [Patescibacteria group bacterium]|nr:LysM peptidoglycan-binding domain-containing protein [Patescibacteria group bacterium]
MKEKFWSFVARRQSTLASGLAALLIIVVGFVVLSTVSRPQRQVAPKQSVEVTQQSLLPEVSDKSQENQSQNQKKDLAQNVQPPKVSTPDPVATVSPSTYTVVRGDNLCQIAARFLGDCNKWPEISRANNLANPQIIHAGNVFIIPKANVSNTNTAMPKTGQPDGTANSNGSGLNSSEKSTSAPHVVQNGDTLWDLAQHYYGNGYAWVKIQAANPDKVGLFADGRVGLIRPNQVLSIPSLSSP